MAHPLIVDIKRHSLEDGPGIRSVVFFKGCPLRCVFCQNPETQNFGPEIAFRPRRCIDCTLCAGACQRGKFYRSSLGAINGAARAVGSKDCGVAVFDHFLKAQQSFT